jgi:very-short-patch-repair endonuclease
MTDAEQMIWYRVRRKQIMSVQFYRQKPLLNFIVDFYCAKARLVIELDGGQHFDDEYQQKDSVRDKALEGIGLLVLRFDNHQVLTETESVIKRIFDVVEERLLNPGA